MNTVGKRLARVGLLLCLSGLLLASCLLLSACESDDGGMSDGYYTAQVSEPDHGWTEFVTICVRDDRIVTAEFQAKNAAGFIKSWDMDYMRVMNEASGTYPNEYVRIFTREFLEDQHPDIDALTGATDSHVRFTQLAAAAIDQARKGDKTVKIVDIEQDEAEE
jgi:major membrane immunogen (membrane-anchored lipoprotein)